MRNSGFLTIGLCTDSQGQIYFGQKITIMESSNRPTSYHDLLKHFKQADNHTQTPRSQKPGEKKLHLKSTNRQNKQNLKTHTQSVHEKSVTQRTERSEWAEEDVLRQYNQKRKDRQLELSYNKFITYITNVLAALTGYIPPQLLSHRITYLQYLAALKELTLIRENYEPSNNDPVGEFWSELTQNGSTCGIFIVFVASILNMRKHDEESHCKYVYLAKKYAQLRYTRMEMLGKNKCTPDYEQFPFTPCISQRSRTLAASRSKSRNKNHKCFAQQSHHHLFQQSQEAELAEPIDSLAGNRRSQILYKLAKEKSLEKRRDKRSVEVQYEKAINELTFHPKIHPGQAAKKKKQLIQGEQDSINRIIRGRVERQVRKIINQKGLPFNQKLFEKMKRQRYEAIQKQRKSECHHHNQEYNLTHLHHESMDLPQVEHEETPIATDQNPQQKSVCSAKNEPIVLTIQVDEDRCEKLIIEDPSQYKEAAAKFIQQFNLPAQMYQKLIKGVENALQFQLTQVDEDSCESEYDSMGE